MQRTSNAKIPNERKVRYRLPRTKCPHCRERQVYRYFSGDIVFYCYVCSWTQRKLANPSAS